MEGTPADIRVYKDTNPAHDHTYYGNACPGLWSPDGSTGSITPCESRIIATINDGDEKNGTYYTFQAASSGTGSSIGTDNTNTPDTFCPLGWQLPYGGTGGDYYDKSKSVRYLFTTYNLQSTQAGSDKARSYPLAYNYSGFLAINQGVLYAKDTHGNYWTSTSNESYNGAYRFNIFLNGAKPSDSSNRDVEYTVRCVKIITYLIDGTVEGTPADLTVYADSDVSHDHTYYGNGCSNAWSDGSITPCSDSDGGGRYTNTADSETQEIGTYYSFAASTSGTGGTMTTSNTNSPDTFCPLGWQLPYSGTGGDYYDKSKSRKYLFMIYGIENNPIGSSKTRSYPISKILSGFYFSAWGKLYYKNGVAYYWSSTVNNLNEAARMYMYSGVVTEEWWGKTAAQTLRCVHGISNLEKLSMASAFTH